MTKEKKMVKKMDQQTFERGNCVFVNGKNTVVVEVIEEGRYHVKNQEAPFDSFIITDEDLVVQGDKEND